MPSKTNQQVLEKAIKIAIDNGWEPIWPKEYEWHLEGIQVIVDGDTMIHEKSYIFNHDFAKALWDKFYGEPYWEDEYDFDPEGLEREQARKLLELKPWQVHLQQMVIADDPLEYLKDNLPNQAVGGK